MGCFREGLSEPEKEILRLRINWIFVIMCFCLVAVSYTSNSPTFHEFLTNPTADSLNQSEQSLEYVKPGLGKSEVFYSLVIALIVVGTFTGSLVTGFAIKMIPYWYIMLFGLSVHVLGYLLFSLVHTVWLIMLSKFLTGVYLGMAVTFALAYFAETSVDYQAAHQALGDDDVEAAVVRNKLFALYQLGIGVGCVLGPGAAAIFAQFNINQLHSVGWFNVAGGLALIALQVGLFQGESDFHSRFGKCCKTTPKFQIRRMDVFIIVFMICCTAILGFKFGEFEGLFNTILSDYFGFTDKEHSYFYLGLALPRIAGAVLLLVLLHFKLDNRVIVVIGFLMTIAGTALMADWQSIPSDPCIQFSPFHHHELIANYSRSVIEARSHIPTTQADNNKLGDIPLMSATSLHHIKGCGSNSSVLDYEDAAHLQTLLHLPEDIYAIAMNKCESAVVPNDQCYWVPNSIVTKHHCCDCQPICRSKRRSLNFFQFLLGATLLMASTPICRVPVLGFISDRVPRAIQGIMIGVALSARTVTRSVSTLWLHAAYDVLQQRTVLAMGLLILVYITFLVGIVLMYRQLGSLPSSSHHKANTHDKKSTSSESSDSGDEERKQLVLE